MYIVWTELHTQDLNIQFCLLILIQRQDKLEIESSGPINIETRRRIQSVGVRDTIYLEM